MYFLVETIETTVIKRHYVVSAGDEQSALIKATVGGHNEVKEKECVNYLSNEIRDTGDSYVLDCRDRDIWSKDSSDFDDMGFRMKGEEEGKYRGY